MDPSIILQVAISTIAVFGHKPQLTEYEFLVYEQSCRSVELLLKSFNNEWEKQVNELENP